MKQNITGQTLWDTVKSCTHYEIRSSPAHTMRYSPVLPTLWDTVQSCPH